jgi:hypothetical protein
VSITFPELFSIRACLLICRPTLTIPSLIKTRWYTSYDPAEDPIVPRTATASSSNHNEANAGGNANGAGNGQGGKGGKGKKRKRANEGGGNANGEGELVILYPWNTV